MLASQESLTTAVAGLTGVLVLFAIILCVLVYMHLQLASRLATAAAQQTFSFDHLENLMKSRIDKLDKQEHLLKTKSSGAVWTVLSSTSQCGSSDATSQTKRSSLQRSVSIERTKPSRPFTVERARILNSTTQQAEPQLKASSSFIQYGKCFNKVYIRTHIFVIISIRRLQS